MATHLICHGAWPAGWSWQQLRPMLRAAGHQVFTPTYTGLGERAHIQDILAVITGPDVFRQFSDRLCNDPASHSPNVTAPAALAALLLAID